MMPKLFGTDGVRGIANSGLTPELAFKLGRAGAYILTKTNKRVAKIIIGTDTRVSKDMLNAALAAGMCSVGARVYNAGVLPTPAMAHLIREYKLDAGVTITASHNAFMDNGIKFFDRDGYKLPDATEAEIEDVINGGFDGVPSPDGEEVGVITQSDFALEDYVAHLAQTVKTSFENMRVAVDCANGAAYRAAPRIFNKLGADVYAINCDPDGLNINKNCGATHMESLVEYVKSHEVDVGLALDGDGDRLLAVDEKGMVVDGDQIMSILALHMKSKGLLAKDTIVATVMSNYGFFEMGKEQGINIEKTAVGDRYVLKHMLEQGYNFGGEQSGHVIFLDHNTTGDGLITALQLLSVMREMERPLSQLSKVMNVYPQVLNNIIVKAENKFAWETHPVIQEMIKRVSDKYTESGRVLIRPSGTEPLIRVMIEGKDKHSIAEDANKISSIIKEYLA
jgi:phosphoglucosamine mutase